MAGALLLSMPAYSQLKFERHAEDARLIFHQDFEASAGLSDQESYNEWSTTPIDTIFELEYYSRLGNSTPSSYRGDNDIYDGSEQWEIFAVRKDSISSEHPEASSGVGIVLFNGVSVSSNKSEIENGVYDRDSYTIINDGGTDADRNAAFAQYGESGGKSYFKYITGQIDSRYTSHYTASTHSIGKYRRNLYVRGLDIEDESSYRLTFYIKTNKLNTWGPLFYADLMRGYHHQRAPFSMGYKSGKDFSYTMDDFEDGKWQKVTIMNYYINDHEADAYPIYKGDYNWTDDWCWRPSDEFLDSIGKTLPAGEVLNYIKQPDKFFIRFSFATDSVEYSLDNITLTKSWIGGCEYFGDKLRVNFGYDTNLDEIVKAEIARTNIKAVEIPNEGGKYFEVWCKKGDDWSFMPIRSAEYHDDGYMYIFTKYFPVDPDDPDGEQEPLQFSDYDSVFVSFHNPQDRPELTLKYTGSLYPKALDTAWVNAGKIVPDFLNELAVPNPTTKIWANVRSIDGLPPIMTKAPYEEGTFGLDANTKTLSFKFQKELMIDDVFTGENTQNTKGVIFYVNNEVWEPSWDESTMSLVATRPDGYDSPLKGDYLIHITQVKALNGDEGDDVSFNYHFGSFDLNPQEPTKLYGSDWRNELGANKDVNECVPASTWIRDCNSGSSPVFTQGNNGPVDDILVNNKKAKCCLFLLNYPSSDLDGCAYYIASRQSSSSYSGHMWSIVDFAAPGDYVIKFKAAAYISTNAKNSFLFYPKPDGDESGFTFDTFQGVANKKTLCAELQPENVITKNDIKNGVAVWPVGTEPEEFEFNVPAAGKYVFEWVSKKGGSGGDGILIGNYSISNKPSDDLSVKYVKKLLSAVDNAQTKLAATTETKYQGAAYQALSTAKTEAAAYVGNFPSKYDSVVAYVNECIVALNENVAVVDLFYSTIEDVKKKLASFTGDSVQYKELAAYKALGTHVADTLTWKCEEKTNAEINAETEVYKKEISALDDRMALIDRLNEKVAIVKALIDAKDARKDYDEYAVMQRGYAAALEQNLIEPADSVIEKAIVALNDAKNDYLFRFDYEIAKTRQIKELYALADSLGYNFAGFGGNKDSIKTVINALGDDDPELSNILREAVIMQILKIYAENNETKVAKLNGLDVSALIPNYFLYNEAEVGRDMEKNGSMWRIKTTGANSTAIPGWTIKPTGGSSNNWYPSTESDVTVVGNLDWEVDGHVFVGGLRCGSYTQGTVDAEIEGLPRGYYWFGLNGSNQTSNVSVTIKSDTIVAYSGNLNKMPCSGNDKFKKKTVGVDSVRVVSTLNFSLTQTSSSSSMLDIRYFRLCLTAPDTAYDYSAAVAAQEEKLNGLITVVAPAVANTSVQYYNLSGMRIEAPKAGEIVIRKTVQGGKVVVDKVLIK